MAATLWSVVPGQQTTGFWVADYEAETWGELRRLRQTRCIIRPSYAYTGAIASSEEARSGIPLRLERASTDQAVL